MTVAAAFKTIQPDLIAGYLAERTTITAAWREKVDAFKESIGGRELFGTAFFDGGWAIAGFHTNNSFEDIPAGWRREGRLNAVPAKRTPEGKEIAATLAGLRLPGNTYPGAPNMMFSEGHSLYPRVSQIGDTYYLTVSKTPRDEKANTLDPEIWEPVKLSEYHAALESGEPVGAAESAPWRISFWRN